MAEDAGNCVHEIILNHRTGEYVCTNCGLVQEKYIDPHQEWRDFEDDDHNQEHTRVAVVDNDFFSLGTEISKTNYRTKSSSAIAKTLSKYALMGPKNRSETRLKEAFAEI